ncbi:MAG: hypothetical protein JWN36_1126, partial [Microbacteriaceae bacterium]|nr:hypothetical protein [Microbacteriaceae bacterium]
MNGVSMTTARKLDRRAILAAAATVALLLVVILSPDAARTQAANVFASLRSPGEAALVAGHRGDTEGAPENTLPALALAIESDADLVETDLQLTSDGVPVLMHDWTVDRTTNGSGPVWGMTYEQLSALDAGSWYSKEFAGTRVPTLAQFLGILRPSTKRAMLELKGSWTAAQLRGVADDVDRFGVAGKVIFASFDTMSLRMLEAVAPALPRVVITHKLVGDPAALAGTCGAVAIVTSQAFVEGDPDVVTRIHAAGLGVLLYTVNDES